MKNLLARWECLRKDVSGGTCLVLKAAEDGSCHQEGLRLWEVKEERAEGTGQFLSIMFRVMHPCSRYYPGSCFVVHPQKYHVPRLLGSAVSGRAPRVKDCRSAAIAASASHKFEQPGLPLAALRQLARPKRKKVQETTLGRFWGAVIGLTHKFQ